MSGSSPLDHGIPAAFARIRGDAVHTPLEPLPGLSRVLGARVIVKWETEQVTGSFKFRGALNKLRALSPEERSRGVVSASTGNHGLAIARASKLEGVDLKLFLPTTIDPGKRGKLEATGVPLEFYGDTCEKTELYARAFGDTAGRPFVSPYNDVDIICGQGAIGLEIAADLPDVREVLVPIGGGGLAAGIAAALKRDGRAPRVVGIEPENSAFMVASLRAGRLVNVREKPTVADAVAGGIEPGAITFPLCRDLLDEVVTVPEARIVQAMALLFRESGRRVEGAGALAVAALLEDPGAFAKSVVVCVASGGNIGEDRFREITAGA